MIRALFDANVLLDVLLDRKPHADSSAAAWAAVESGQIQGMMAGHSVTTIYYLIRREFAHGPALRAMGQLLRLFAVAAVDQSVITAAIHVDANDFEDAVTAAAAQAAGCELLVTRDPKGFRGSHIRVVAPEQLAAFFPSRTDPAMGRN
jgi:predicted nucleic acid-binding protein